MQGGLDVVCVCEVLLWVFLVLFCCVLNFFLFSHNLCTGQTFLLLEKKTRSITLRCILATEDDVWT